MDQEGMIKNLADQTIEKMRSEKLIYIRRKK